MRCILAFCLAFLSTAGCDDAARPAVTAPDESGNDAAVQPDASGVAPQDASPDSDLIELEPDCEVPALGGVAHEIAAADAVLVLPEALTVEVDAAIGGARFDVPGAQLHGFVVRVPYVASQFESIERFVATKLLAMSEAGLVPVLDFSQRRRWPDLRAAEGFVDGVQMQMRFFLEPVDDWRSARDPVALREAVLDGWLGAPRALADVGSTCADAVEVQWFVWPWGEGHALVTMLAGCRESYDAPLGARLWHDLASGTQVAPLGWAPDGVACQSYEPTLAPYSRDYLMVVDNSLSMLDEQGAAVALLEQLRNALAQHAEETAGCQGPMRVAVTTTEAWLLDVAPDLLAHDELLDRRSGLRGEGFIDLIETDAVERLYELIAHDPGCEPLDALGQLLAEAGANLCGSQREDGILSALAVLERIERDTRPQHRFQPASALPLVVWVSDEEAFSFRDESGRPLLEDDPRRTERVDALVARFDVFEVFATAVIGDSVVAPGGACEAPADEQGGEALRGAEPGTAYRQLARALKGTDTSICASFDHLFRVITIDPGYPPTLGLETPPVASSLELSFDGEPIDWFWTNEFGSGTHGAVAFSSDLPWCAGHLFELRHRVWRRLE